MAATDLEKSLSASGYPGRRVPLRVESVREPSREAMFNLTLEKVQANYQSGLRPPPREAGNERPYPRRSILRVVRVLPTSQKGRALSAPGPLEKSGWVTIL